MAPPNKVDRDSLHRYLWRRSDRQHKLPINARLLAEELGYNYHHTTRIIREMCRDGRLRSLGMGQHAITTYMVTDPAVWTPDMAAPTFVSTSRSHAELIDRIDNLPIDKQTKIDLAVAVMWCQSGKKAPLPGQRRLKMEALAFEYGLLKERIPA